jgi:hypothetical protein
MYETGESMSENTSILFLELSVDGGDPGEVDDLTRELARELNELNVEQVEQVSEGDAPAGSKALDMAAIGNLAVTLAPTLVGPLFEVLKSWVERKPSTPVKVRVRVGRRTAEIEYDPTRTSAKDLEALIKALNQSVK